ncbi:hypothetical protein BJV74DRAFT_988828 [Russula compacta]|nr:hypothetical protein BJV74DRAFT_988828 [Russula compacta]
MSSGGTSNKHFMDHDPMATGGARLAPSHTKFRGLGITSYRETKTQPAADRPFDLATRVGGKKPYSYGPASVVDGWYMTRLLFNTHTHTRARARTFAMIAASSVAAKARYDTTTAMFASRKEAVGSRSIPAMAVLRLFIDYCATHSPVSCDPCLVADDEKEKAKDQVRK